MNSIKKPKIISKRLFLAVFITVSVLIIGAMGYSYYTGNLMVATYTPLIDATMEIKLEATTAHLWFEEILNGDMHEDIDEVWRHLELADWYINAMIDGGENQEGTFLPIKDDSLIKKIKEVKLYVENFKNITHQRYVMMETSIAGTDIDEQYDSVFRSFITQIDGVETKLQDIITTKLVIFRWIQIGLILTAIMLIGLLVILFSRFDKQKKQDYFSISKVNALLEEELIERKRFELELMESEEKYRFAMNATTDGLWDWNVQTGSVYYSPAYLEIIGEKDISSKYESWGDRIHSNEKELVFQTLQDHLKGKTELWQKEHRLRHKSGEWVWVLGRGSVVETDRDGKAMRMVGTMIDISQRKLAEKELIKAKEKAQESDRLKSTFLANMSHEIRTPMNGILGFTSLLKKVDLTEDKQRKFIGIIEKSGERMLSTINDIIDISRIESGDVKTIIKPTNINSQLESLYDFFKPEADKKNIKLVFKPGLDNSSATIQTDPEKFDAIITNLIKNAIKFTHEGYIKFGYTLLGENISFYVKDTGDGIQADKLEHVFERFIQEDMSNSSGYEGSGLGLSIVKAYVDLLGGKVWLESKKDEGSTFYFTIPYTGIKKGTTTEDLNVNESLDKKNNLANKTILIVEDDETSFEYLEIINKDFGINTIIRAKNGEEAIEVCKNSTIDLVLMDIKMPIMNGYEAAKAIKKFKPHLPIIAQTANAISGDREKSVEAGCDDYITKPINEEDLLEKYNKYLT